MTLERTTSLVPPDNPLSGKRILLGVSGGIAAYKTPELVRALIESGAQVQVVMSANAGQFVAPLSLQVVSRQPVFQDIFDRESGAHVQHIAVAAADLAVLAPATANLLGKLAHGIADDALTTVFLAVGCPTLVAPAMNEQMWRHPAVGESVSRLRKWGYHFVGPEEGFLAEGYSGVGRMSEPLTIVESAAGLAAQANAGIQRSGVDSEGSSLEGTRVLVTAGPTREYLDAVRFLSSPSSGRMGYALAAEAAARGARVTLVTGPTELPAPVGVEVVEVVSAEEMLTAGRKAFTQSDILMAVAAVADFRPASRVSGKAKKADLGLELALQRTPDVLAELASEKGDRFVVGFAAETENLIDNAKRKLAQKNLDLIVANDVGKEGLGFGSDYHQVQVISPAGSSVALGPAPKTQIAAEIWDRICAARRP